MSKKMIHRCLGVILTVILLLSTTMTCFAVGFGGGGGANHGGSGTAKEEFEYYSITINTGDTAYARGTDKDDGWLVRGVYTYNFSFDGEVLSFRIGNQRGTINVNIPEGYKVGDYNVKVTWSDASVNSQSEKFDCAICAITIKTIINKENEEEIPFEPEPTEPEPTEPEPTEPEPTEPEPTEPEPTEPEPTEPEPTEPEPTEPEPTEPEPTEPEPTEPEPTEPEPTEPEPTEPEPTDPEPTEPETTEPKPTEVVPDNPDSTGKENTDDYVPKTGDRSSVGMYVTVMAVSLFGIIVAVIYNKKMAIR